MARIGYARGSSIDQDLDIQIAKLKAEGCEIVRSDKISGGSREVVSKLETVTQFLRPGDELVVALLDRHGRDRRDVLNLIYECEQRKAFVTVLAPQVSTRDAANMLSCDISNGDSRRKTRSGSATIRAAFSSGIPKAETQALNRRAFRARRLAFGGGVHCHRIILLRDTRA